MKYSRFDTYFSMGLKMDKDMTHSFLINLSATLNSGMAKINSHYSNNGIVPESKDEIFNDLIDMHRIVSSLSNCYRNLDEITMTSGDSETDSASPFCKVPRFEVRFSKNGDTPKLHDLTFTFFDKCELAEIFRNINASMVLGVANIFDGDDDLLGLKPETNKED